MESLGTRCAPVSCPCISLRHSYTIEPDYILVIAVMHCHREPGYHKQPDIAATSGRQEARAAQLLKKNGFPIKDFGPTVGALSE